MPDDRSTDDSPDSETGDAPGDGTDDSPDDETGDAPGDGTDDSPGDETGDDAPGSETGDDEPPLPDAVVEAAERLTRQARRAVDDAEAEAYREDRAERLGEHDYAAMVRSESAGDVLVCHPEEWLVDGDVHPDRIEDVDRAVEVPLSGADEPDDWDAVAEGNREVAAAVREAHGDVHGANADAFTEYVSNHYAKPISSVTADELRHFREEYYPRNVWPSDEEAAALDRSLELVYEELSVPLPDD